MKVNMLFVVLTLIIIVIVILMSDSLVVALITVMLLLNFLAVGTLWKSFGKNYASMNIVGWGDVPSSTEPSSTEPSSTEPSDENSEETSTEHAVESSESEFAENTYRKKSLIEENRIPSENTEVDQNTNLYGRAQEEYDGYITAYTDCWRKPKPVIYESGAERDYSIDSANVMMAQKRARDKRCIDGKISKDAGFFKHHYAGELDESEAKVWWGQLDQ